MQRDKWFGAAAVIISLQLLFCTAVTASGAGDWMTIRGDKVHSGYSEAPGELLAEPEIAWRQYLGAGTLNQVIQTNIDGDADLEMIFIQDGAVAAYNPDFGRAWRTERMGAQTMIGVYTNLGTDGIARLVVIATNKIVILNVSDGSIAWQVNLPGYVNRNRLQIADLDNTKTGLEIVAAASDSNIYAYAFDNGIGNGYMMWAQPHQNEYIYAYHYPVFMVADMDGDGNNEICFVGKPHSYVLNGKTGAEITEGPAITPNGNDRNYGLTALYDVDNDGYMNLIILADGVNEHLTVLDYELNGTDYEFSERWKKEYEFDYTTDDKVIRPVNRSIGDLDNDGTIEIVYSYYNDTGDDRWHTVIVNAEITGFAAAQTIDDMFLHDVVDLDNDGNMELLLSSEPLRAPGAFSTLKIYALSGGSYVEAGSIASSVFLTRFNSNPVHVNTQARTANRAV